MRASVQPGLGSSEVHSLIKKASAARATLRATIRSDRGCGDKGVVGYGRNGWAKVIVPDLE